MRVTQFPGYRGVHLLSPALADVDTTLNFAWEGGGWGTIRDLFCDNEPLLKMCGYASTLG